MSFEWVNVLNIEEIVGETAGNIVSITHMTLLIKGTWIADTSHQHGIKLMSSWTLDVNTFEDNKVHLASPDR